MTLFEPFNFGRHIILILLSAATFGCNLTTPNQTQHVVVKVNDDVLRAGEFSERLAARLKSYNTLSAKDSAVVTQAKSSIVQDFIVRSVTQAWAEQNHIFVKAEPLAQEIQNVRKQYPDDIAFRKSLADAGLTYSAWEDRITYTLLEKLVIAALHEKIHKPSEAEISKYYLEHKPMFTLPAAIHIRQIVLDSEASAQRIKKDLQAGKSFTTLAKKYSISPDGDKGGDAGWIEKGTLDVFDSAFRLGVGQRSSILKSPFGFHIIEVIEKRPSKSLNLEQSRSRIQKILMSEKEQAVYSAWLEEQVLKSRVYKDDEFINQIQVQTRSVR